MIENGHSDGPSDPLDSAPQINEATFHPRLWRRFWSLTWPFWVSERRKIAWGLLVVVVALTAAVTGLNVVLNYVGNYFQTALASKNAPAFHKYVLAYLGVFAIGTPIIVLAQYTQNKLSLHWRSWLASRLLTRYFTDRAYYAINLRSNVDNPDQRLTQDVADFTSGALGFLTTILQSLLSLFAFIGILLSISHLLTSVMLIYAAVGTGITLLFGRRLVSLNFNQQRREADFRYGLVRVRDNTESIAFYGGEASEAGQAKELLIGAIRNFNLLIGWQRNLGFFTTSYNYLVLIVPFLVVAPLYFAGKVPFGTIAQAAGAFGQVLTATTLIVQSFSDITAFVATVDRLSNFSELLEAPVPIEARHIRTEVGEQIALDAVTLETPDNSRVLIRDLSVTVPPNKGLLIVGPSGCGKSSLLRAIAGLWQSGSGRISRPDASEILFLPQNPYTVLGSLRRQLLYPRLDDGTPDTDLYAVLDRVNLGDLAARSGGLDAARDWDTLLSLGERQRLAFARVLLARPTYAVLDEATSALDGPNERHLYEQLREVCPCYVSVGHNLSLRRYHQHILELDGTTHWSLSQSGETVPVAAENGTFLRDG